MEVASGGQPFTVDDVLDHLGQEGTRSQRDSIRRAMRHLGAAGAITLETDWNGIKSAALTVTPVPKVKAPPKPKRLVSLKQPANKS
jgi:Fe2+ or Zn2+ uptake regulation protein